MYNEFSYIYDKLSFDIDYKKYSENIIKIIEKEKINTENALELAAGTGRLSEYLIDKFKNYDALDYSSDMLSVFQKKNYPNVRFFNMDMVEFLNKNSYDVIIILLDSINYITDKDKLIKLFENCYCNLKEEGILIFDINSPEKIINVFGNESYVYEYEDIFYTWENEFDGKFVDMYLNFFVKENDRYKRIEEYQKERLYYPNEIEEILENIGYINIKNFDEDTMKETNSNTMRILFKAKKEKED
ncbi:MAG: class I SAM-dependent methyltransferase [Tissierellia bacterium]|nr:class I SAM-dependent methyltransferase [Tissierellia bacterium]